MATAAVHSYHPRLHPHSAIFGEAEETQPLVPSSPPVEASTSSSASAPDAIFALYTNEDIHADDANDVDLQAALIADPDNVEAKAMLHARSQTLDKVRVLSFPTRRALANHPFPCNLLSSSPQPHLRPLPLDHHRQLWTKIAFPVRVLATHITCTHTTSSWRG